MQDGRPANNPTRLGFHRQQKGRPRQRRIHLFGEFLLEGREVGPPDLPVDPVIACAAGHEEIHYRLAGYARRDTKARRLRAS
jgi:hypothetical protein